MLVGGLVAECLVGTRGLVRGLESQEGVAERWQAQVAVLALPELPELPPHRAIEPLDAAVQFGGTRWQHGERHPPLLAGRLDAGDALRSAVDLDGLDREGEAGVQLIEEGGGRARRGAGPHAEHGTARDHVNGRELAPRDPRLGPQVPGVALDQLARLRRLPFVPGHPRGLGSRLAAVAHPNGMGLNQQATSRQARHDAADRRCGEAHTLRPQQVDQLGLAGAGEPLPQGQDRAFLRRGPLPPPGAVGPPRAQVGRVVPLAPAGDRRPRPPEGDHRRGHARPVRVRHAPQPELGRRVQLRAGG